MMLEVSDKPKPFHLMTPAEKTAARIAQNRAIEEKIKEKSTEVKTKKPPASSTADYVRATPEERAALRGSLVRKVQS
jgi:hypothetical protein